MLYTPFMPAQNIFQSWRRFLFQLLILTLAASPIWAKEQPLERAPKAECRRLTIDQVIHFDEGKFRIRRDSIAILNDVANTIAVNPQIRIEILGFSVPKELFPKGEDLSERRAREVAYYLISKTKNPQRIRWKGMGSEKPMVDTKTNNGRAKNRRVEFETYPRDEGGPILFESYIPGQNSTPVPANKPKEGPPPPMPEC